MEVMTPSWWSAAGRRAAYTALAALVPIAGLLMAGEVGPGFAASVAGLAAVLSLAWSLRGLPEVDGTAVPWWKAILTRALKTAGEVALPALSAATLFQEVGWQELGVTVGGAVLTTVLRTALTYLASGLPEDVRAEVAGARGHSPGEFDRGGELRPAAEVDTTPPPPGYRPQHRAED